MTRITDIAREVGARDAVEASNMADLIEFTHPQLDAFADRIRAEESARLDWLLTNRNYRVQGSDAKGWFVLDCGNGLTFITRGHATPRDAIDAAMAIRATPTDQGKE